MSLLAGKVQMPTIFSRTLFSTREEQLCRVLHIILILLYVALVTKASQHYEHGLNFPFTPSGQTTISVTVSIISQGFGTLYLAGLVLVTQRLALIHDLHTRQTLTAIHDKTSAWLGLGSSLLAIVDQIKLPSAVFSVAFIGSYLLGIAALHITIPASVSVNTYNATIMTQQTTQLARPLFYSENPVSFDILNLYNQFPQIGLQDNMIYDVLPVVPAAINDAVVNATYFNVDCGALPRGAQSGQADLSAYSDITWTFSANFTKPALTVTSGVGLMAPSSSSLDTIGIPSVGNNSFDGFENTWSIVVAATIPVVDASQTSTEIFEINPGMAWYIDFPDVDAVQMFMCNISTTNTTISVSAVSRQPIATTTSPEPVFWEEWSFQDYPTTIQDPLINSLTGMCGNAPGATHEVVPDIIGATYNTSSLEFIGNTTYSIYPVSKHYYSMIDQFLMQDLNISAATPDKPSNISLSDFQRSLGKAMAAIVWYDRNGDHSSVFSYSNSTLIRSDEPRIGQATVEVLTLRIRLNFNIIPLSVGLGVSCLLFALTFPLSGGLNRREITNDLNAAGILQLTWLLGNESHFAGIRRPERQELRQAGLFDVQMSARAKRKAGCDSSDYEPSEEIALKNSPTDYYIEV
ncbi:hypothetical protein BC629DRAFT_1598872 [Irpex lacteus]|nr:hypothetical protein BC629DRAFT_1598872 [Irpex lacteus]